MECDVLPLKLWAREAILSKFGLFTKRYKNDTKKPRAGLICLFFRLFMRCSLSASITKLFEVDFALNRFAVFDAVIIDLFAGRAGKFYQMIL